MYGHLAYLRCMVTNCGGLAIKINLPQPLECRCNVRHSFTDGACPSYECWGQDELEGLGSHDQLTALCTALKPSNMLEGWKLHANKNHGMQYIH